MAKEVSTNSFESEVLNSVKPVLVDFWAPWCGPCRAVAPILDEISNTEADFEIAKVNIDENPELAMQYRIQSIPTMILFSNGKAVATRVGGGSKQDIVSWTKSNM